MEVNILAVFCEDIRREFDGRFILLGVYPGTIFLNGPDDVVSVSHYIQVSGLKQGKYLLRLRAVLATETGERELSNVEVDVEVRSHYPVIFTPTDLKLRSDVSGIFRLLVSYDDEPEIEAATVAVEVSDQEGEDDEDDDENHQAH